MGVIWGMQLGFPAQPGLEKHLDAIDLKSYETLRSVLPGDLSARTVQEAKKAVQKPLPWVLKFLLRLEVAAVAAGAVLPCEVDDSLVPSGVRNAVLSRADRRRVAHVLNQPWLRTVSGRDARLRDLELPESVFDWLTESFGDGTAPVSLKVMALVSRLEAFSTMTLGEEVESLVTAVAKHINRRNLEHPGVARSVLVTMHRLWYPRSGQPTFVELAAEYYVSKQRIQSLTSPYEAALAGEGGTEALSFYAPALDMALAEIAALVPAPLSEVEDQLAKTFEGGGCVSAVLALATLMKRDIPFEAVRTQLHLQGEPVDVTVLESTNSSGLRTITKLLRNELTWCGAVSVSRVVALLFQRGSLPPSYRDLTATLEAIPSFKWLQKEEGWFTVGDTSSSRLACRLHRMLLCATTPISVETVLVQALRDSRLLDNVNHQGAAIPPPGVLLALFRTWPWVSVTRQKQLSLRASASNPAVESDSDSALVSIVEKYNGVCTFMEIVECLTASGIPLSTAYSTINPSPILLNIERGIYQLVGRPLSPKALERAQCREVAQIDVDASLADLTER